MSVLLVHDGSALTTTTTAEVTVFASGAAFPQGSRPYFFAEQTGLSGAAASNSAIGLTLNYVTPGANTIALATTTYATFATNGLISGITFAAPWGGTSQLVNATDSVMPCPSQVKYSFTTAGTACGCRVWAVIPNR